MLRMCQLTIETKYPNQTVIKDNLKSEPKATEFHLHEITERQIINVKHMRYAIWHMVISNEIELAFNISVLEMKIEEMRDEKRTKLHIKDKHAGFTIYKSIRLSFLA